MSLSITEIFLYTLRERSLYGNLAAALQRVCKPGMGTMAVGIRNERPTFFYDPTFIADLTLPEAAFALEHEMLHLVLDHIPRFYELLAQQPTDEHRAKAKIVSNIAMDCAINTMLRDHPGFAPLEARLKAQARAVVAKADAEALDAATAAGEPAPTPIEWDDAKAGMVLPEKYGLPRDASFDAYLYLLMQQVKTESVTLTFGNSHDMWTDGDEPQEDQDQGQDGKDGPSKGDGGKAGGLSPDELASAAHRLREQIKDQLRAAVRAIGGAGRGTLPGNLGEWLEEFLAPPIIPWWEVFSTRARTSRLAKFQRSCQLPNRTLVALAEEDEFIIPLPGRLRDKSWRVFVMVDTSGSMSTESLQILKSELSHMLNADASMEIRYMQGDCSVHYDELLRTGDPIPAEMHGRGGTDFDAYFQHMHQYLDQPDQTPDLVIVYTDGYAPPVSPEHRMPLEVPVLWLVTPDHNAEFGGYGEVLVCDKSYNGRYKT